MLKRKIQSKLIITMFLVTTFVTVPLSSLAQKASPAPKRAQVEAVVKGTDEVAPPNEEKYLKFSINTSRVGSF